MRKSTNAVVQDRYLGLGPPYIRGGRRILYDRDQRPRAYLRQHTVQPATTRGLPARDQAHMDKPPRAILPRRPSHYHTSVIASTRAELDDSLRESQDRAPRSRSMTPRWPSFSTWTPSACRLWVALAP